MNKLLVNRSSLQGIADAIREKNGESTLYKPREMSAAIRNLPNSSTLQTLIVTENGIYIPEPGTDGFDRVSVAVPTSFPTFAFVTVISNPGVPVTATDGNTTLTSDGSGKYVFSIPNAGIWTFSDGSMPYSQELSVFGEAHTIYLSCFSIVQDASYSENGLTLAFSNEGKTMTVSWTPSRDAIVGFIVRLSGGYSKVRVSASGTGTKQFGNCSENASLPSVVNSGSGRGAYYSDSKTFTVSDKYPRIFAAAYGVTIGAQITYSLQIVE